MVWSKTLAFPMLCCFASPLTNTVHVGPKRKPKVRNGTTGLAISALLLLATAFSAASSSLSASLMACLMSSITRMPAANCWCGRRWSDCDGRSYRTTDTHPPCRLSPAVSGAGRAGFLNSICEMYFSAVFLCFRTDTDTYTHPGQLPQGRHAWIFHPCSAFTGRLKFTLTPKKQRLFIPDMCFLFCPLKGKKT